MELVLSVAEHKQLSHTEALGRGCRCPGESKHDRTTRRDAEGGSSAHSSTVLIAFVSFVIVVVLRIPTDGPLSLVRIRWKLDQTYRRIEK
jgi:hypothetical protein